MNDQIEKVINQSVPSPFIKSVTMDGGRLVVELQEHADYPDYFFTGDKLNKVLSIEVARWFCKLPEMTAIDVTVRMEDFDERVVVDRAAAEDFYGVELNSELRGGEGGGWQTLLEWFDTHVHRERFVELYGVEPEG